MNNNLFNLIHVIMSYIPINLMGSLMPYPLHNYNYYEKKYIIDYTPYTLKKCINIDKNDVKPIIKRFLSNNLRAVDFLEENKNFIDWNALSLNPNAIKLLENNLNKINWYLLCINYNAIHIIEKNINKVDWNILSCNPNAVNILENNIDKINWSSLSSNISLKAINILENNLNKINWINLSQNPSASKLLLANQDKINIYMFAKNENIIKIINNEKFCIKILENYKNDNEFWKNLSSNKYAIPLLEDNIDKIDWDTLSGNLNAIHLLEKNQEKINWTMLSRNLNAIHLLEKNQEKIVWTLLCENPLGYNLLQDSINKKRIPEVIIYNNPNIFTINYKILKEKCEIFKEELMQKCYHPKRLFYYLEKYKYDIGDDLYYLNDDYIIEI